MCVGCVLADHNEAGLEFQANEFGSSGEVAGWSDVTGYRGKGH